MGPEAKGAGIPGLTTGVPGLDAVIGEGGIPEFSLILISGNPGAGKTTLAQQFMFANATVERPAIYFTVVGEPPLKMMRFLQQRSFFKTDAINRSVRFVDLSHEATSGELDAVYNRIVTELENTSPAIVVVDSFRSVRHVSRSAAELAAFVQRLAVYLSSWQATTFIIGEYLRLDEDIDPVFTVADGVLWLQQTTLASSVLSRLQVVKMRGRNAAPGLHAYRTTEHGVELFANIAVPPQPPPHPPRSERVPTGVPGLDALLAGGLPGGGAVMIVGPAGAGKTILSTQFLATAATRGDNPVLALFEETPHRYFERARTRKVDLPQLRRDGKLHLLHLRGLDFSVPQIMHEILTAVINAGARSLVIDSVTGLEVSLDPSARPEFRQALYRLVMTLTEMDVTVVMTLEQVERFDRLHFSEYSVSFLADAIISLRYVELDGGLRKVLAVVKVRDMRHSSEFHLLEIDSDGGRVGAKLEHHRGVLTGVAERRQYARTEGLTAAEQRVIDLLALVRRSSLEQIVTSTGLSAQEVRRALRRVASLGLATKLAQKDGAVVYRIGGRRPPAG